MTGSSGTVCLIIQKIRSVSTSSYSAIRMIRQRLFIKRIIGLPGETIEIRSGKVYVDGSEEPLDDSFCWEEPRGDFGPFTKPEGCYFMMGDNLQ